MSLGYFIFSESHNGHPKEAQSAKKPPNLVTLLMKRQ
jgi:hypothetical protein